MRLSIAAAVAVLSLGLAPSASAATGDAHVDTTAQNAPVSYPMAAQRSGRQGTVRMLVRVSYLGLPTKVRVVRSSGFEDLDEAAAAGVLRWHYVPATHGYSRWADVQVEYRLPTMLPSTTP
jgi:TonB family protein